MPRYELTTDEELTETQKVALARAITEVHASVTGAPRSLVHVVYLTTGPGNAFVAGEARPGTHLQGFIRAGRDAEMTTTLLSKLAAEVSRITGAPGKDVTVALREGPPRLVLEGGQPLPELGQEDDKMRH
jgi:phenylpyruvate tautomerase PptA (4-oxalocrotonate tautomerase family)